MAERVTLYPVRLEQDLAWGEQDALGHVNNTVFFRFFENARVAHFLRVGIEFPKAGEVGLGPILARANCDFLKPLTFPDRIRIEAGVSRIGSSSFTHSYRIFSFRQQDYVARVRCRQFTLAPDGAFTVNCHHGYFYGNRSSPCRSTDRVSSRHS